ncbi:SAYSvFN domain-containing protein 1 [Lampris incognitus]|uniref:SAYSvFN domain-containing protein 1 n=1 Tax=Lampris incognitus TaxID=2546036 RepID=UPI0024B57EEE|nr:SAYSvFN domain-containing protein 1 [Lampris incognitus]
MTRALRSGYPSPSSSRASEEFDSDRPLMEQKLADFRARRKAERATKGDEGSAALPPAATTTAAGQTCPSPGAGESLTGVEPPRSARSSPRGGARVTESSDWLLNSALGKWLGSQHLAFSNLTVLKVLLWLVLLGLFVELGFGLPFFLVSLFYWLYEGLRSPAAHKPGELSAYSVFNPDCQPLLGTLTAEQLEGEMGYRPLANR